jgi:hypothetical protein
MVKDATNPPKPDPAAARKGADLEDGGGAASSSNLRDRTMWAWSFASIIGPGMLNSLADTDAGCLVVAADSGARWGYSLVSLQLLLIPVLFLAQELTVRLGIHTGKGHTACIRERYGRRWAWATAVALVTSCVLATVSEMSGIASVGELWGLSRAASTGLASVLLLSVVCLCGYAQVRPTPPRPRTDAAAPAHAAAAPAGRADRHHLRPLRAHLRRDNVHVAVRPPPPPRPRDPPETHARDARPARAQRPRLAAARR